jgi:GNAT superfamily N-acetyltransferase
MVTYHLATEEDYLRLNDFYNRIYGRKRTLEQFRWEFHDCPFGSSIYVYAADEDIIVGTNCAIPFDLIKADKTIIRSAKSEDTLVDPEYRGQNIFYNIYKFLFERCKEQGIQLIWGFTSAKKPFEKVGFEVSYEHLQSLGVNRQLAAWSYLSSLNPKNGIVECIKIFGLTLFARMKLIFRTRLSSIDAYVVTERKEISNGVGKLIEANLNAKSDLFAINQTEEFQNWRVYHNPNYSEMMTFGYYTPEKKLRGLIVMIPNTDNVAYVLQSSFHPEVPLKDRSGMILYASDRARDKGISLVRNWEWATNTMNKQEIDAYDQAGHFVLEQGIGFVWKKLGEIDVKPENFLLSRIASQGTN